MAFHRRGLIWSLKQPDIDTLSDSGQGLSPQAQMNYLLPHKALFMLRTDILGCHSFIEPHTQCLVHMLSIQNMQRSRYTGAIDDLFRLVDFDVVGGSEYSCVQSSPLSVSQLTVAPGCMPSS